MNGTRQSDFAKQHGMTAMQIKAFREKNLTPDDWWKDEAVFPRVIWWTESGLAKATAVIEPRVTVLETEHAAVISFTPEMQEALMDAVESNQQRHAPIYAELGIPQPLVVRVIKPARNKRFVYGALNGETISIQCGRAAKKIIGKTVTVRKEGDIYIYCP